MAVINLDHTIQKFIQVTEQSFLYDFGEIAKSKQFISSGNFKGQLKKTAADIYNGAKTSGLNDEEALHKLEEAQNKLIRAYTDEYQQLLQNNNMADNVKTPAETKKTSSINTGDIDPEIRQVGRSYATFYKDRREPVSGYAGTNNTYSMCDMVCQIDIVSNTGKHVVATLGKLQTLSYSIFQKKDPVRVIGNMNAKDYVYGQRTIAGSLIFAVFNKHWLIDLYDEVHNKEEMKNWHFLADEIPPFNVTISFANEYGYDSRMAIYGVRLMNEGQTMSINDIYIENTYEYVATDIEYMDSLNAWQTSNKLGRRYNTTSVIAPSKPTQSEPGTPRMNGQSNEGSEDTPPASFKVEDPLVHFTDTYLNEHTEKEAIAWLDRARNEVINQILNATKQEKEGKTQEEQKKIDKQYNDAIMKMSRIYSRQWDEIKAFYKKQDKDKAKES